MILTSLKLGNYWATSFSSLSGLPWTTGPEAWPVRKAWGAEEASAASDPCSQETLALLPAASV